VVPKLALFFLGAVLAAEPATRYGRLDPAFQKIPFDQWLTEHPDTLFHWKAHVTRAGLSFHQRLEDSIEIELDGKDLETRRGDNRMVFFTQITDRDGAHYQEHSSIELSKLDENIKAANLQITQRAFFLPGDYRLAVAILDTATGEHSATQMPFRVAAPPGEFLPDAWRGLPPVEFIDAETSPDSWFLPAMQGRLAWAASLNSPARLNVILNIAPSVSGGMAALLPFLKVLSQTGSPALSENIALLDLGRRRAVFHQNDVKKLDWSGLKASLTEASTASIDLHSLSEEKHDAQFFVSQVRSVLRASEKPSVLVVLTTPVAFDSGEDLDPISLEALPASRVIYIRYRSPVAVTRPFGPQMGRGRGGRMGGPMGGGPMGRNPMRHDIVDQLEATLKPLHPKVFDVETPEQMTKALKDIRAALTGF
jgi:hypothetical protein